MNAVCKAHFQSLSYSRKLVVNRMKREPTRFGRILSFNNQVLLLPSSHTSFSKLIVPSSATTHSLHVLADEDRYDISSTEIRRVIKSHFGGYQEGFTCVTVNCPSCNTLSSTNKEASNDLGKLHINLRTGYSFCTRCFLSGPWSSLASYMKALGASKLKSEKTKICKGTDIKSFDSADCVWLPYSLSFRSTWHHPTPVTVHSHSQYGRGKWNETALEFSTTNPLLVRRDPGSISRQITSRGRSTNSPTQ